MESRLMIKKPLLSREQLSEMWQKATHGEGTAYLNFAAAIEEELLKKVSAVMIPATTKKAVAVVQIEPDYWHRGHFIQGKRKELRSLAALDELSVGTKVYAAPLLTKEQRIAIEAAISISNDVKSGCHDGSYLTDDSVRALQEFLSGESHE